MKNFVKDWKDEREQLKQKNGTNQETVNTLEKLGQSERFKKVFILVMDVIIIFFFHKMFEY